MNEPKPMKMSAWLKALILWLAMVLKRFRSSWTEAAEKDKRIQEIKEEQIKHRLLFPYF